MTPDLAILLEVLSVWLPIVAAMFIADNQKADRVEAQARRDGLV